MPSVLCDGLVEGMGGDLGLCRSTISDMVGRNFITCTWHCELHHSAEDEATGNRTDGDKFVFTIGLFAGEKTRPSKEIEGDFADAVFRHKTHESIEGGKARAVKFLSLERTVENLR